jgi:hypothetical protein
MLGDILLCFSADAFHYFIIFMDVYTKYIRFFPLVTKSDVFIVFQPFQVQVER